MTVLAPTAVVLILCKVTVVGPPDQNAAMTGAQNLEWATEHSMMVCRREEIQIYDQAEDAGAQPVNPDLTNPNVCSRIGIPIGVQWDMQHRSSNYRFWRVGCPSKIVDLRTGKILGYHMPDCGHRDTVICETDSAI
jgi:hypothetical protein